MKKRELRKLIRETIREQVGGTQGSCLDPCANNYDYSAALQSPTVCDGTTFGGWPYAGSDQFGTPEFINDNCIPPYPGLGYALPIMDDMPEWFACCEYENGVRGDWSNLQPGDPKPTLNTFGQPVSPVKPNKPQVSTLRPAPRPTSPANRPPKPPTSPANKTPKKLR